MCFVTRVLTIELADGLKRCVCNNFSNDILYVAHTTDMVIYRESTLKQFLCHSGPFLRLNVKALNFDNYGSSQKFEAIWCQNEFNAS